MPDTPQLTPKLESTADLDQLAGEFPAIARFMEGTVDDGGSGGFLLRLMMRLVLPRPER